MKQRSRVSGAFGLAVLGSLWLAACGPQTPTPAPTSEKDQLYRYGSILGGEGGFNLLGGGKHDEADQGGSGIGVNSFLWRASLDTLSFLPIASADPFGGVILTDWYTPPGSTAERLKVNVYIMGRQLRANGVKVSVFRQTLEGGQWRDQPQNLDTAAKLEDTILTRARQLRIAAGDADK